MDSMTNFNELMVLKNFSESTIKLYNSGIIQCSLEVPFFYNTNQLKSGDLAKSIEKCKGQEKTVYEFFLNNMDSGYCWSEVLDRIGININACSLKRAITNLKIKGFLIKTEERVMSKDGGLSHRYKFNKNLLED